MDNKRPISRRREHFRATHFTRPSTLSVQVLHGHRIVTWDKEDISSLDADKTMQGTYEIILRPPRRHLHAVGEGLHTLEDRMKSAHHGT
jgi:hypothetical protein